MDKQTADRLLQQRRRYFKIIGSELPEVDREFESSLNEEPDLSDFKHGRDRDTVENIPSLYDNERSVAGDRNYIDFDRKKTFVVTYTKGETREGRVIDSFTTARDYAAKRYGRILEVCSPKGSLRYAFRVYRPNTAGA